MQVNYLGYPGTIGAPWLDYIIGDAVVLPFDDQDFYSEKIVHLPHCYQANDARRAIAETAPTRAEAGLPEAGFVFCCFNAAWKITPAIFDVWMRLLKAVPDSVLWLLEDNASMTRQSARRRQRAWVLIAARLVFAAARRAGGASGAPSSGGSVSGHAALWRPYHRQRCAVGRLAASHLSGTAI